MTLFFDGNLIRIISGLAVTEQRLPFKNLEHALLVVGGTMVVEMTFVCDVSVTSVLGTSVLEVEGDIVDDTFCVVICVGESVVEVMIVVPFVTCIVEDVIGGVVPGAFDVEGQPSSSSPFGHC